jgi:hypothetical protein
MIQIHCAKTVPESNVFMSFGLGLERKQIPRFVEIGFRAPKADALSSWVHAVRSGFFIFHSFSN